MAVGDEHIVRGVASHPPTAPAPAGLWIYAAGRRSTADPGPVPGPTMPPLSRRAFARSVRGLPEEAFVAFVAAVWAARGFETAVDGRFVHATAPDTGEATTLFVAAKRPPWPAAVARHLPVGGGRPGWDAPPDRPVDVVVTRRSAADGDGPADVVTVDGLRRMVLYALDRETAATLVREHLGRPLAARPDDGPTVSRRAVVGAVAGTALVGLAGAVGAGLDRRVGLGGRGDLGPPAGDVDVGDGGDGIGDGDADGDAAATAGAGGDAAATAGAGGDATATGTGGSAVDGKQPAPATGPPCATSPAESVERQLFALLANTESNDGIRTVWAFGSNAFHRYNGTYEAFVEVMHQPPFRRLLEADGFELGGAETAGGVVRQPVVVTADGERHAFAFLLSEVPAGERAGCWLTEGLSYVSEGDTPTASGAVVAGGPRGPPER